MSKILLIGKNYNFMQKCAERLRWRGYNVLVHEDLLDGLREMMILSVDCIIWNVESNASQKVRNYKAIQRYHRFTPVVIIDNDRETYGEITEDTYFVPENPEIEELVQKVATLIRPRNASTDDDEMEEMEEEYGLFE